MVSQSVDWHRCHKSFLLLGAYGSFVLLILRQCMIVYLLVSHLFVILWEGSGSTCDIYLCIAGGCTFLDDSQCCEQRSCAASEHNYFYKYKSENMILTLLCCDSFCSFTEKLHFEPMVCLSMRILSIFDVSDTKDTHHARRTEDICNPFILWTLSSIGARNKIGRLENTFRFLACNWKENGAKWSCPE